MLLSVELVAKSLEEIVTRERLVRSCLPPFGLGIFLCLSESESSEASFIEVPEVSVIGVFEDDMVDVSIVSRRSMRAS